MDTRALTALVLTGCVRAATAQHAGDFLLRVVDQRLETGAETDQGPVYPSRVGEAVFGEGGIPNFTDEPGFDAELGALIPGMSVGFDLTAAVRTWDPSTGFAGVNGDRITVRKSGIDTVTPLADAVVPGIVFGQANLDAGAGFHHHVQFILNPAGGGAPDGVWLLTWELWTDAPGVERTEPVYVVFAQGDGASDLKEALHWVEDHLLGVCGADLAEPFGLLNFFDLSAFLASYAAQEHGSDLAAPFGVWNFFDVSAYLGLYNAGCP